MVQKHAGVVDYKPIGERIDEQSGDPSNGKMTFIYPWIITVPTDNEENGGLMFSKILRTSYNISSERWFLTFRENFICVMSLSNNDYGNVVDEDWDGSCFVSYKLFYDNDMRFEFFSSNRVATERPQDPDTFQTPAGFLTKFYDAYEERKISKMVIYVEFVLPTKLFFRPFDNPSSSLCKWSCDPYPKDMETNFIFQFLKQSDFTIQCSDGSTPASRCVLNISSIFMKKYFKKSSAADNLIVDHSVDVIKPLMLYLHSFCFEMPKCFSLDFADRLLKAVNFFQPIQNHDIKSTIQRALCKKIAEESFNFNSLLQFLSLALQHSLFFLEDTICVKIANKYYYKWNQTFPENTRNTENPMYRDIFGSEGHFNTFGLIEQIFTDSLFIKAILH